MFEEYVWHNVDPDTYYYEYDREHEQYRYVPNNTPSPIWDKLSHSGADALTASGNWSLRPCQADLRLPEGF
jgi:hypothetical protein